MGMQGQEPPRDEVLDRLTPQDRLEFYLAMLEAWNHFERQLGSVRYAQVWMAGASCWLSGFAPSVNKLSEMTGIDRRSVKRELERMQRMGLLTKGLPPQPTPEGIACSQDVVYSVLRAMYKLRPICDRAFGPSGDCRREECSGDRDGDG